MFTALYVAMQRLSNVKLKSYAFKMGASFLALMYLSSLCLKAFVPAQSVGEFPVLVPEKVLLAL